MKDDRQVLEEIKNEFLELTDKLARLEAFIASDEFYPLGFSMIRALETQRQAMIQYREALFSRIKLINRSLFNGPVDNAEENTGFLL